jgi:hypothetical protein
MSRLPRCVTLRTSMHWTCSEDQNQAKACNSTPGATGYKHQHDGMLPLRGMNRKEANARCWSG